MRRGTVCSTPPLKADVARPVKESILFALVLDVCNENLHRHAFLTLPGTPVFVDT